MKKFVILSLIVFSGYALQAQDQQFSQYFSASLFLNPAFAGVYNFPSAHMNHKRQLSDQALSVNELTQVSIVIPVKPRGKMEKSIGGFGIMAYNEKSGPNGLFQNNAAFLTYAHNFKFGIIGSDIFTVGVQVGYENQELNFDEFQTGSQFNPFIAGGFDNALPGLDNSFNDRRGNVIVNAGLMYYYNQERNYLLYPFSAFSGISVTNINQANKSFVEDEEFKSPMLFKYHGGVEIKANKVFVIPSALALYQGGNYQFNAGIYFAYDPQASRYRSSNAGIQLLLGSWYRFRDAFIFVGGVQMNSFGIRASYDMNSKLFASDKNVNLAQSSFEIALQYFLAPNVRNRKMSNPLF